jgi:dTMP kinase
MYLSGELGSKPDDVNAYAASMLFTVDRFASFKKSWQGYYEQGGLLLADRYTTSNAVHQGSKFSREERKAFFKWLSDFEYGLIGLPSPDIVIYLDLPAEYAVEQLRKREAELQTIGDIHERNTDYLMKCSDTANEAADFYGWVRIKCLQGGVLRSIEDIHKEIISRLGGLI